MTTIQHVTSHHWRGPTEPFMLTTEDGVSITGSRIGEARSDAPALVWAHGLMGWHRKPRFAEFAELLSQHFTVFAPDLRGHGQSGGTSDFGGAEIWDVDAVVRYARDQGHGRIVTSGTSMGGIAVVRHAALLGGTDAVVSISSLAYWDWHAGAQPWARQAFQARVSTAAGRAALRAWGVRLPEGWEPPESPEEVVGKIAPTPSVIVHGRDDPLFSLDHAERLYEAANDPKRLLIGDGFGHAEDGLAPEFAERLTGVIREVLELP